MEVLPMTEHTSIKHSMFVAWIKLYGKFLRHIRAVEIGHPQPGAHPSMFPSFQEEVRNLYKGGPRDL
jgi:hypothetical protein